MNIEEALIFFKNKSRIAESLNISKAAVSKWEKIPPLRVYEIKEIISKSNKIEMANEDSDHDYSENSSTLK